MSSGLSAKQRSSCRRVGQDQRTAGQAYAYAGAQEPLDQTLRDCSQSEWGLHAVQAREASAVGARSGPSRAATRKPS